MADLNQMGELYTDGLTRGDFHGSHDLLPCLPAVMDSMRRFHCFFHRLHFLVVVFYRDNRKATNTVSLRHR